MDYRWHKHGFTKDFFWYKGKADFTDVIFKNLKLNGNEKILVVGSGTGFDLPVLKKYGQLYATDIEQKSIDLIPNNLVYEKKVANVCDLPYENEFFDVVIAFEILEYVEDEKIALNEIDRVLKKNGHFVFTLPAFSFLYSVYDKYNGNLRRYNKTSIKKLLKGFKNLSLGYWLFFLFLPAAFQRLLVRNKNFSNAWYDKMPSWMNKFFYKIISLENWLISKKIKVPFGLSLWGICRK